MFNSIIYTVDISLLRPVPLLLLRDPLCLFRFRTKHVRENQVGKKTFSFQAHEIRQQKKQDRPHFPAKQESDCVDVNFPYVFRCRC